MERGQEAWRDESRFQPREKGGRWACQAGDEEEEGEDEQAGDEEVREK